ncbi:hypothetical protein Tco_0603482 [Tanacetum coccineum]
MSKDQTKDRGDGEKSFTSKKQRGAKKLLSCIRKRMEESGKRRCTDKPKLSTDDLKVSTDEQMESNDDQVVEEVQAAESDEELARRKFKVDWGSLKRRGKKE